MTMLPPYPENLSVTTILAQIETAKAYQAKAEKAAERSKSGEEAETLLEVAMTFQRLANALDEAADYSGQIEDFLDDLEDDNRAGTEWMEDL